MRIPRILIPGPLQSEPALPKTAAHHLQRVLRLRPGHPLIVFDGEGAEFEAELLPGDRVRLGQATGRNPESPLSVCLIQGISRGQRMDYTLQKAVELGVDRIRPVFCERSVVRLEGKRLAKRHEHWLGVIEAACEQSGRIQRPRLDPGENLATALESTSAPGLFLDPEADSGLKGLAPHQAISLVVGPEGGLSEAERKLLRTTGFQGVRLGPRVLRTETAGVAALAALQTLWGDFD